MSKYTNAKYPDKINDLIDNDGHVNTEKVIASGIQVLTEAPTEDNPEKDIKFVYLDEEPAERFNGYYYLIGSGSSGGSVDLFKQVFTEQKEPVPTTGYLAKFFFDRKLTPEQVDSLIANANLTFIDLNGDGSIMVYPILAADSTPNSKLFVIVDSSAAEGPASGAAWIIMEYIGGTIYYVSPAVAEKEPDSGYEAGWQKAAFASDDANYITVEANLLTNGPFGAQNDLLTELVYVGSWADSGETEFAKSLTGQYKIVEKNIKLNTKENTTYSYDFINSINDDTKEISVIKNIEVDAGQEGVDEIIQRSIGVYTNDSAREIGFYAFAKCFDLKEVSFTNATSIDDYAFYDCNGLGSVEMPLVESIGRYAFSECQSLDTVTFPKARTISEGAFYSNINLREINLPEVRDIGLNAFSNCSRLVKVFISQTGSVCSLRSDGVFADCSHNVYIYVPARLLSQYKKAEN